jgi:hypothetical protein
VVGVDGHIGIAQEDLQPRPAFVGVGQGFAQWIAGQQSSIGGRVGHPGKERPVTALILSAWIL